MKYSCSLTIKLMVQISEENGVYPESKMPQEAEDL